MGLKRIMAMIEVTYAEDDARDLEALTIVTRAGVDEGTADYAGTLASWVVTGAMTDPDPEPTIPETGFAKKTK